MTDASQNLSMAERIDTVCDQFEREFRAGQRPALESVLASVAAKERPALFRALLELELELRQKWGETPQPTDYQARFPAATKTIAAAFEAARRGPAIISSVEITGIETSQGPKPNAAVATPSIKPGPLQKLGRFAIKSVLGEGAFGTVYRAHDPQLDRDVAVKVPRFAGQQSQEDRARFLREARAAAGLHHAHICPVHEVGNVDGRDYIVLSFIDGKPLSKILQAQPKLSNRQIAAVIRKLALALQEAHDLGIIHRDLKPANIMINRKGEPVIMDFGLARRSNSGDAEISHNGQIMGTPAYMSPEQARGDGKAVGPATDIYSLGIVLYEMICGRRPFEGTVTEVIASILHVDPPRPSQFRATVDPRLEQICLRAIAKKSTERFATMKELATALAEYARAMPTDEPAAEPAVESGKELPTNQFADLLAAISSEMESNVERAVRRVERPVRMSWWSYLVGSGVMGLIVLLGILFFIRKDTVTVIVNIPIENIHDPALSFFLDDKPIAATAFAEPIELKPGEHHLVVNKDGKLFKEFRFQVGRKNDQPIVVQDMTPPSAPPEEPPAAPKQPPPALKPSPLDVLNAADIPDGQLIKNYGSREKTPRELVGLLTNHNMDSRDTYASMDIASDGKVLATSRYPLNWIILRNLASGLQFGEIATEPKQGWVHFIWLRFSSDGKTLYGQRIDEDLYAYAVGGKKLWHTKSRKNYCYPAVAPDDSIVVVAEAAIESKDLRVLDARTGEERTKWKGLLDSPVYRLEFSPDGKSLAVMSGKTLKLVDPRDGSVRKSIALPMSSSEPRFRYDGKTVFHTHDWKEPEDYIAETILETEITREYRLPPHGCRNPVPNPVFPIFVTSDKQKKLHVWDTELGPGQKPYVIPLGSNAEKVEFTPEGRYLVAAANTGVFVFRLPVNKKVAQWGQPELAATETNPDSDRVVAEWILSTPGSAVRVSPKTAIPKTVPEYMNLPYLTRADQLPAGSYQVVGITLSPAKPEHADLTRLASLKNLKLLWLLGDQIHDELLTQLSPHQGLFALKIQSPRVTSAGVAKLRGLTNLDELVLNGCKVDDSGLKHLAEMSRLNRLELANTAVTGTGLADLKQLKTLRRISLGDNRQVNDETINVLADFQGLNWLDLTRTSVTDARVKLLRDRLPKCQVLK